ncbi:MAG: sugar kinase, partial [Planctomycetes bacterium]|nr:sugar kinase [Planctomycetota bacterium]
TGAGDSFAGGFMGHLAKTGRTDVDALRQAVVSGTVMASFTCSGISLERLSSLTAEEVSARAEHFTAMLNIPE